MKLKEFKKQLLNIGDVNDDKEIEILISTGFGIYDRDLKSIPIEGLIIRVGDKEQDRILITPTYKLNIKQI